MKTGTANLPLHYGAAPRWLFSRMTELAREITFAVISEFSAEEMLLRLSDPFWFQAFGCVLGFDWHSSGLTTTTCGALKQAIKGHEKDLGLFVAGGKGGTARKTPQEIEDWGEKINLGKDPEELVYASRMSAKVDSSALQDGYQVYHHNFIFTLKRNWTVVQQGMNTDTRWARRYHWNSSNVKDFVCEPHSAICCDHKNTTLNLVAAESAKNREISAKIAKETPKSIIKDLKRLKELDLPGRHEVLIQDINVKNIEKILLKTYERAPNNFEELLGTRGVGPKTLRAISLIAELVYKASASVRDPVAYSFAHGGKDGYPYPIDRSHYDESIDILKSATAAAKIGHTEKMKAFKRLAKYTS